MAKIPSVYIIDRDPDVRYKMQGLVQQAGFAVSGEAGLGTEAVALAKETRPDIMLCGVKEPLTRAVQTVESLAHVLPQTPIIVYSESADLDTIRRVMLAGARDFLKAPFNSNDLRRSLSAAMESEERRRVRDVGGGVLGPEGIVITVFGAKGGVGKTTVATNLAVAIARSGQTAVLIDIDDTFGDAASSLALTAGYAVTDALREVDPTVDIPRKLLTHHESGLAVLPAPASPFAWKGIPGERLKELILQFARRFDIVVVDTASTLSDVTLAGLQAASIVLWVTTPEYASVRDSLQALQVARGLNLVDDRIGVILNIVSPELEVHPSSIEEALSMSIFWTIPYDRLLRQSAQLGQVAVDGNSRSPAAKNLIDLAHVLTGARTQREETGSRKRFLKSFGFKRSKRPRLEVPNEVAQ